MEVKELTCAYAYHKLGTRCCAINAATLALVNAGIPMRDLVCACAAGCIDGTPLLDLNYVEDSAGGPDLPLALLPKSDRITLLQMDSKLPQDLFKQVSIVFFFVKALQVVALAIDGCKTINTVMVDKIKEHATRLIGARGATFVSALPDEQKQQEIPDGSVF